MLKPAQYELDDAFDYYESQVPGLGAEFLDDVLTAFKRIESNPEAWPLFSKRTRRCLATHFHYGIIYQMRNHEILIVAIAHLHRHPEYWQNRVD